MRPPARWLKAFRFTRYLLWEFRWPLGVFSSLVFVGGFALQTLYHHRQLDYAEACYAVFLLIFIEPYLDFPSEWYLVPFFFLVPLIGLGAVADSIVRLGFLVFAKKRDLPEWQRMVASTYRNHVVVAGAGKVGLRIIRGLIELREAVVVVERQADAPFLDDVHDLGVPVIIGSCRLAKALEQAGVRRARAIILATDDDLANIDGALTARDLNPAIRVVLRLFDDTLAHKLGGAFHMPAISPSQVSAPAFIAAATGRKVYHQFQLDGHHLHLVDLTIDAAGSLVGCNVGRVQSQRHVNIVMHKGSAGVSTNPDHDLVLQPGDTILVMADIHRLADLEAANQPPPS